MFGKRDFLDDSSSSFEGEQPGTPPPYYQQEHMGDPHLENEFDFDEKPMKNADFFTAPTDKSRGIPIVGPDTSNNPGPSFQPMKKEYNEKVGFVNFIDETPDEPQGRPVTSVRPGSSSAQMRAKMLEAQKSKLMGRQGGGQMIVQSSNLLSSKAESAPLDNLIYSNTVYNEKDISGSKALKAFNNGGINFEPGVRSNSDIIPGPIKSEVTVIKSDDIEEMKLDEQSAVHNVISKNLQEMHKKMEESQRHNAPIVPPKPLEAPPAERIPERIPLPEAQKKVEIPQNPVLLPKENTGKAFEKPREEPTKGEPIYEERLKKLESKEEVKEPPKSIPRPPNVNVREILANEMQNMRKFLTSPVIRGITLQCTIRRDKSGFSRIFPKYYMSVSEQLTFLLAGKKRAGNRTSNYMMTMNQKDFKTKSQSFLGKVRSNFLGTEFMMYDHGLNPKRKGANPSNVRAELGAVLYVFII